MQSQRAVQILPGDFSLLNELNLSKDIKLLILLNLASLGLFVAFGLVFIWVLQWLRPDFTLAADFSLMTFDLRSIIVPLLMLLGLIFGMVILHEAVHGLFFWLFTGGPPKFGFRGAYAYAAAPGWYISKVLYLIVSLAPLVLISIDGFVALMIVPPDWILPVLLFITMNASGSVGDIYAFFWVLAKPGEVLIEDFGDRMRVYAPNRAVHTPFG